MHCQAFLPNQMRYISNDIVWVVNFCEKWKGSIDSSQVFHVNDYYLAFSLHRQRFYWLILTFVRPKCQLSSQSLKVMWRRNQQKQPGVRLSCDGFYNSRLKIEILCYWKQADMINKLLRLKLGCYENTTHGNYNVPVSGS